MYLTGTATLAVRLYLRGATMAEVMRLPGTAVLAVIPYICGVAVRE